MGLAVCYFIDPDVEFGRGIAALAAPFIVAFTLGWRLLWFERGQAMGNTERMLIMGTGPTGISLARDIISRPELRLKVVGFLDEKGEKHREIPGESRHYRGYLRCRIHSSPRENRSCCDFASRAPRPACRFASCFI